MDPQQYTEETENPHYRHISSRTKDKYIMHYTFNYDSASSITKVLISINGAFPFVSFIRITRGISILLRWVSMFIDRTTSIITSPVDFCDGNFSITFTRIPILSFFLFFFLFFLFSLRGRVQKKMGLPFLSIRYRQGFLTRFYPTFRAEKIFHQR